MLEEWFTYQGFLSGYQDRGLPDDFVRSDHGFSLWACSGRSQWSYAMAYVVARWGSPYEFRYVCGHLAQSDVPEAEMAFVERTYVGTFWSPSFMKLFSELEQDE